MNVNKKLDPINTCTLIHWGMPLIFTAGIMLSACAPSQLRQPVQVLLDVPPPSIEVYFYPKRDQTPEQRGRDRYECYLWSKKQTGFDPSSPNLAPQQRVRVVPTPAPGHDTVMGAITGGILGAAVSPYSQTGEGALVGAIAGAIIGSVSDAARQEEAERIQQRYDRSATQSSARAEAQARNYRRAMSACLEGRGYSIQ